MAQSRSAAFTPDRHPAPKAKGPGTRPSLSNSYALPPTPDSLSHCTVSPTHTAPAQLASDEVAFVIAVPFVEYAAITSV